MHLILNPGFIINDQSVCVILYTNFNQLFRLILTAPIHCRTSIFISCLDSFWRHPFTAEHLFLSAVWIILTAPFTAEHPFYQLFISFWWHPFTCRASILSAVWTHSDGTHSLKSLSYGSLPEMPLKLIFIPVDFT